jgi:molecular chaperone GrpE (heat shock protein)
MKQADSRESITLAKDCALVFLCLFLALALFGCEMVKTATNAPGQVYRALTPGTGPAFSADPVEVQNNMMRFANAYFDTIVVGFGTIEHSLSGKDAADALRWKLGLASEVINVATGPRPISSLIDLTIFVSITKQAIAKRWPVEKYKSSAPLLESIAISEADVWRLSGLVIKSDQQKELKLSIDSWCQNNPNPETILIANGLSFAEQISKPKIDSKNNPVQVSSVFSFLGVDPLSGLDPATREIAQTRMFAERALFVTQKIATLMRWQVQLLTYDTFAQPDLQQMIVNSTKLTSSLDKISEVATALPEIITAERVAIISSVETESKNLTGLATQVKAATDSGAEMSNSLNRTLVTFDALMKRFGVGEIQPVTSQEQSSAPFNILDYAKTASSLESAAKQISELLRTLDQTTNSENLSRITGQVNSLVNQTQKDGKNLVDYAFYRVLLVIISITIAAFIYKLSCCVLSRR